MTWDIENLRDRFAQSRLHEVAQDLDRLLNKHAGKLPPHLPDVPPANEDLPQNTQIEDFTFELEGEVLPLTERALRVRDRNYVKAVIYSLFSALELREKFGKSPISRTRESILRGCYYHYGLDRLSIDELLKQPDEYILDFYNMGPKTLLIYNAAVQPLRNALARKALPPQN